MNTLLALLAMFADDDIAVQEEFPKIFATSRSIYAFAPVVNNKKED